MSMQNIKRNFLGLTAVVVAGLAASYVGASFSSAHAADGPIRFGLPLSLTGALADAGEKADQGMAMCVEAVNARGGIKVGGAARKLELVKYDYQSETNRAVQLTQRLITVDKVDFIFAPYGSGDTKATAVVAERYGIPMMAWSAATESVYDQNFKNLFGILFPNKAIVEAEVRYFKKAVPDAKRMAIVAMNSLYPKSIAAAMKKAAEAGGFEVVFDDLYSPGSGDFSNLLTQIKNAKPDWIYVSGYTQDLILVRRQMADVGVAKIVTMTAGPTYPEYTANLKGLAENITSDAWWHDSANYKDNYIFGSTGEYAKAFEAKYKKMPSYLEAAATAGCEILAQAIEGANSTKPEDVRAALKGKTFDTFYGPVRFGPTGQNDLDRALVLQIRNGKNVILAPDDLKQGELVVGVSSRQ